MKTFRKGFIKTKLSKETSAKETFRESFIKVKLLGKASAKKPLGKASAKAQSAMEYLMTYGWAILIIAVVLGALFELGVFNANNFAPKAPPGACQVFRPNGPGTTSFINLEGVCNGEIPQYVAQFNGNGYMTLSRPINFSEGVNFSISAWVNAQSQYSGMQVTAQDNVYGGTWNGWILGLSNGYPYFQAGQTSYTTNQALYGNFTINDGQWHFIVGERDGTTWQIYVDGRLVASKDNMTSIAILTDQNMSIGGRITSYGGNTWFFQGSIAGVQIYNTSLSTNDIQALYLEGIGGAPINLQNLVGWWPLNGNANDYSGNEYNAQTRNASFVSNWYSGYTPP